MMRTERAGSQKALRAGQLACSSGVFLVRQARWLLWRTRFCGDTKGNKKARQADTCINDTVFS